MNAIAGTLEVAIMQTLFAVVDIGAWALIWLGVSVVAAPIIGLIIGRISK